MEYTIVRVYKERGLYTGRDTWLEVYEPGDTWFVQEQQDGSTIHREVAGDVEAGDRNEALSKWYKQNPQAPKKAY